MLQQTLEKKLNRGPSDHHNLVTAVDHTAHLRVLGKTQAKQYAKSPACKTKKKLHACKNSASRKLDTMRWTRTYMARRRELIATSIPKNGAKGSICAARAIVNNEVEGSCIDAQGKVSIGYPGCKVHEHMQRE